MKVTEAMRGNRAKWDLLYSQYADCDTLLLGIVDYSVWSEIRWDIMQLNWRNYPAAVTGAEGQLPEGQRQEVFALWRTYIVGARRYRNIPASRSYSYIGVYGALPVLKHDAEALAGKVKGVLEEI